MTAYSLASQIAEVERELRMRREVYPRLVTTRKLRQAEADMRIAIMQSVLDTLTRLSLVGRQE